MTMASRLDGVLARYQEIEHQLSDPEAHKDLEALQNLGREQSRLRPIVEAHQRLVAAQKAEAEVRGLLGPEGDPEMVVYLKEEAQRQRQEIDLLEDELPRLLIPEEPNEERSVLLEIISC